VRVVGLTGGIGAGKSTVADMFRAAGVPVIDADAVARDVVEPGQPALRSLVTAFGDGILTPEGRLDRGAMRAKISADPEARQTLSSITHPAIGAAIAVRLADMAKRDTPIAAVEAALMVETGSYRQYQSLVVVTCSPETQLARVMARDGSTSEAAAAFIATQRPMHEKEALADVVIRNDGDLDALQGEVHRALAKLGVSLHRP